MKSKSLSSHLQVKRYGDFELTDAIRPAPEAKLVPKQGYRLGSYRDAEIGFQVPVLAAAVSRDRLFNVFLEMIDPLGPVVDVVLESSHESTTGGHRDYIRTGIDLPVLESNLWEFEELLLNDGCTGIAVISTARPQEIQFDEHKLLVAYAREPHELVAILEDNGIARDDKLKLISEAEHLHTTEPRYESAFHELCNRLGASRPTGRSPWAFSP
ncbi:MAG: hypothetical protein AB7K24_07605 [Gemmataceae bacterium]